MRRGGRKAKQIRTYPHLIYLHCVGTKSSYAPMPMWTDSKFGTLLLTMLYRLTPTLIEEGKVFIAESPLFEITTKDQTYFAYTEAEKETFLKQIEGQKCTIQRSKGLGENEPDMMSFTTMNPETRRLIQVMPEDAARTSEMFDLLLGDNLSGRKTYIAENGYLYIDSADVS